jgi:hypothetical protein
MASHKRSALVRRIFTALGRALKRGLLGRSTHDYMSHFTGSDDYWDRAIAAQVGWAPIEPLKPVPDRSRDAINGKMRPGPGGGHFTRASSDSEYEPVHGWTRRQLRDYLVHNPGHK